MGVGEEFLQCKIQEETLNRNTKSPLQEAGTAHLPAPLGYPSLPSSHVFCFVLAVLGFELRASCRLCTT
jgi:hypothetical protein